MLTIQPLSMLFHHSAVYYFQQIQLKFPNQQLLSNFPNSWPQVFNKHSLNRRKQSVFVRDYCPWRNDTNVLHWRV